MQKIMRVISQTILYVFLILIIGCKEHSIESFLNEQHQKGKFNGSVLVVKNDKILYKESHGYSDGSKTTLLNNGYLFNIGSIYKEFPAVAIIQLKEKNLLKLDDKINKYLIGLPEWSNQISIKNLLLYSSGLPKVDWNKYFNNNLDVSDEDLKKDLIQIETLEFQPGLDYLYTNYSPILLIEIIEAITGQKFKDYAKENLFIPNNLNNITIKSQYPYKDKTLMAIPFDKEFKEDYYKISAPSLLFSATTEDLYNWLKRLHDFQIISKESLKILSERYENDDDYQAPIGFCSWDNNKVIEHSHHGSSGNYECIVRKFNKDKLVIIILTNQKNNNLYKISDKINEIITTNSDTEN